MSDTKNKKRKNSTPLNGIVFGTREYAPDQDVIERINNIIEENPQDEDTVVFYPDPKKAKANAVKNALLTKPLEDIVRFARMTVGVTPQSTIDDIVEAVANERITMADDSKGREIYQAINADILQAYIQSIRIQGFDMDDTLAAERDLIKNGWDFRDQHARILHKLKSLVIMEGDNDEDLFKAITDLEELYSGNTKKSLQDKY